jgi:hypothetical protein
MKGAKFSIAGGAGYESQHILSGRFVGKFQQRKNLSNEKHDAGCLSLVSFSLRQADLSAYFPLSQHDSDAEYDGESIGALIVPLPL